MELSQAVSPSWCAWRSLSTVSQPRPLLCRPLVSTGHSPPEERRPKGKVPEEQAEAEGLQASQSFSLGRLPRAR